jgi:hypothetical protein
MGREREFADRNSSHSGADRPPSPGGPVRERQQSAPNRPVKRPLTRKVPTRTGPAICVRRRQRANPRGRTARVSNAATAAGRPAGKRSFEQLTRQEGVQPASTEPLAAIFRPLSIAPISDFAWAHLPSPVKPRCAPDQTSQRQGKTATDRIPDLQRSLDALDPDKIFRRRPSTASMRYPIFCRRPQVRHDAGQEIGQPASTTHR